MRKLLACALVLAGAAAAGAARADVVTDWNGTAVLGNNSKVAVAFSADRLTPRGECFSDFARESEDGRATKLQRQIQDFVAANGLPAVR
jgi:hypothetical protein